MMKLPKAVCRTNYDYLKYFLFDSLTGAAIQLPNFKLTFNSIYQIDVFDNKGKNIASSSAWSLRQLLSGKGKSTPEYKAHLEILAYMESKRKRYKKQRDDAKKAAMKAKAATLGVSFEEISLQEKQERYNKSVEKTVSMTKEKLGDIMEMTDTLSKLEQLIKEKMELLSNTEWNKVHITRMDQVRTQIKHTMKMVENHIKIKE